MAGKRFERSRSDAGTKWVRIVAARAKEPSCPSCSAGVFRASPILRHLIYSTRFLPREKHQLLIKLVLLQFSDPKPDELSGRTECC